VLRHPPSGDAGRIGRLVAEFIDGCVLPAASAAGAQRTRPAFGPTSAVTAAAEMLFTRLADAADGEWPLTGRSQGLWDELISVCLAEQVGIDRTDLGQWLEDSGWEKEAVTAIADRCFAGSRWLAKRLAVMAP
jgi:hypothetical protein